MSELRLKNPFPFFPISAFRGHLANPHLKNSIRLYLLRGALGLVFLLLFTSTSFSQTIFTSNTATGNWDTPGSWLQTGTVDADGIPDNGDIVTILSGHSITLNVNSAASSLTIDAGAVLSSTGTSTFGVATLSISGTYTNGSTGAITATSVNVNAGGTYIHGINGGTIPTATWAPTSTCSITGITATTPGGATQTFGNVLWNSAQSNNINFTPNAILGNFEISNTGASQVRLNGTPRTVSGNLIINGGDFAISSGAARTLNVTGNVILTSGTLDISRSAFAGILNVTGDFSHTGGVITKSGTGTALVVFNKTGTQTYTSGGTISNAVNFTVNSGATLQMATATTAITGAGTFTLASGATIGITSPAGITSAGATGNIQTTVRNFSTGASYIYNGSTNQNAGNGLPGTVANLTIDNSGGVGNNTVSLPASKTITSVLNVSNGIFALGANNITSVGAIDMTGTSITGTGTITLAGDVTTNASSNTATISSPVAVGAASRTFTVADGAASNDLTVSSVISGASGITKAGNGLLNLSGANTYGGSTTINNGTLRIGVAGGVIPNTSAVIVTGILDLSGHDETIGSLSGAGLVTSSSAGTVTLTTGGDNTSTDFSGILDNGSGTVATTKQGTGVFTLSGANTYSGGTLINAGTLKLGSSSALGTVAAGTVVANGGALDLNGINYPLAESLTLNGTGVSGSGALINSNAAGATYSGNVTLASSGTITTSNTIHLSGVFSGAFDLTKNGAGTLSFGASPVSVIGLNVSSGTLTATSGVTTISGNFINSGSFNHNGGTVLYNAGTVQTIAAINYNNLSLSGAGQKNAAGAIDVVSGLTNASVFNVAGNALTISGAIANTGTIRFSGAANGLAVNTGTIEYYGPAQTITSGTYNNLIINQSSGQAIAGGDLLVNGTLALNAGNLNLIGTNILTFGATSSVTNASSTRMIIATNGSEVRKNFVATGSFDFPIGDNTSGVDYSPVSVNITSASGFSSAYISVYVVDAKHPSNASTTHFLSRYWNITQSGITACVANVTGTYVVADINGTEGSSSPGQLTGTFNKSSNPWIKYAAALGANTLNITGALLAAGQTSSFTGITGADPVATITGGAPLCQGNSVALNTSVAGGDPVLTYSWSPALGLSAANVPNPTANPTITTTYIVTVTDGNGISDTDNVLITVNTPPAAPTVSTTGNTICDGDPDITLTSSAAPNSGSYTWYKDGVPQGIFSPSININDVPYSGSYTVTVTDGVTNCSSAPSAPQAVTINPLPLDKGVSAVTSSTICEGSTITVRIASSEPGINYELQNQSSGSLSGIFAGTGGNLDITTTALLSGVSSIKVIARNAVTLCSRMLSGTVAPVINAIPSTPVVTPAGAVIQCLGSGTVTLTSSAGSAYQWYKDGVLQVAETGSAIVIGDAVSGSGSYQVRVYGVSPTACASSLSSAISVTVKPMPGLTATNNNPVFCSGGQTNITLSDVVTSSQISIFNVSASSPGLTGFSPVGSIYASGSSITDLLTNSTNAIQTVTYTLRSAYNGCIDPTDEVVTVTVNPNPSFSITNTTAAICSGSAPVISVSSPTSGAVITLQSVNYGALSNGVYSGGGTFGTGGSLSEGNLTNVTNNPIVVTYTFSVSTTATPSCPLVVSTQQTTVTVQPAPSFSISNVASSICSGSKTDLTLNTPVSGGQIRLKSVTYGAVTGSLTAGALYADGQTISETLVNTTNAPITVQYEFESFAGPCGPGTPSITTVTVNPNPSFSITNTTAAICSGSAPVLSVSSPTSGAVITLQSVNYGALSNGVYSGGGTFGTGGSLSEGNLTNVTNNPIVVTYTFSVSTTATPSCPLAVSTQQTTVTVQPAPSFSISNVASSICSGSKTDLTLNTSVSGGQIRLKSVTYGAVTGSLTAGALYADGQTISETLVNTTNAPITVQYEFESFAGPCGPGTPSITTVTVNPNPSFSITNTTAAICSGSAPVLSVSSPTSGAVITLQSVNYGALSNGAYSGGGTFGTGGSLSEGNLTNVTNNPIVVTYTFSVSTTATPSCPLVVGTQQTTVTVQPAPSFSISNVASSICSGSKTDLTLNTSVSGGQIRLKSVTYGAVTGSLTAGALYADGQTISETLVNTTNAPITVQYEFESFAGPCGPGTPSITTVTVNPNPSFSITNTTAAICSGSAPVLSVSSPTSGAVITLQSVNYGALSNGVYSGGGTFGTGGSLSEGNLTNVTNNPIVVTYTFSVSTTATPSCPLVVSTQQTTVTVQPAPSFSISNVASSICSGSKTDLTLNTSVSGGQIRLKSVTYGAVTGSLTAGALYADGQTISETLVNTTNAPITVQYEFESFAGPCGPGTPSITTVTVNPNPSFSITNTTAAICSGSAPVLSVSSPTSGAVITLQSVNYGALSNGVYSGGGTFGTGGSLSEGNLTNVTNNPIVVTYTFSVSTTATPSCPLVVSTQQTTVTVQPAPSFSISNVASSICSGSKTDLTLNTPVSGGQIRLKSVTYGAVTGSLTAGALYADGQTISETLVNTTNAPITVQYEFESFAGTCGPGTPSITTVTVNPNPSFSITNTTAAICSGSAPVLSVSSPTSGAVITLQSVNYGALSNGVYSGGGTFGTGGSLSEGNLTNVTNNPIVVTYTFSVSTTATPSCPLVVSTQQTTVTVQPAPSFSISNVASSICSGSKTDLTLNTPVSGGQIRLKSVTYGAVTGSLTAGALYADGQTISETLVNTTNAPITVQYEFESFAGPCGPGTPSITTVTVNPNPSFSITNTTAAICSGSAPVLSVSSPTSGAVITLQSVNYGALSNGVYSGGGTFGTGGSLSEGNLTNVTNNPIVVTYTFSVSTTATPSCPLVVSTQQTTVTVQPAPSFSISNVASSICSGSKTDLTLNTPVSGGQIRLKSVTYGAVTGSLTAGALYADGQTISETLVNTTNAPITVQYEFESFAGPCGPGTPSITTVTVNPNPSFSITNTTAAICSGSAPVLSVSSPTSGAVITLQSVNYGALSNGVYSGGGTFGTGGSLSEGNLTNVTNNPIVVTYTFSVSTTATPSCPLAVSTQQTTVTVQPAPSFSISNVASSICSGSKTDLTLNTSVSGGQIRLKSVTYGAVTGSLTAGALYADGQTISETLVNTTNAPITVQYEFESFAGPCGPGTPSITTVTVNPNPSFSITNTTAAICSGSAPVLSVSSPTSGAVITLQSVNYGALSNGAYSGGGTFGTGGSLSEGNLTNVTNNPIVVTYTFSVSTTATPSCPLVVGTQQTTVTVQPAPSFSISNVASSICSGSKTDLTLNTSVSGGQIRLKSVTYGAVTGSLTAGALYADGQTISETLVNTTNAPITVQYEFESFAGPCGPGTPSITTVTVNPNPSFSITNTTAAICSGSAPVLSVSSPTSGAVITLQSVNYGALSNGAYSGGGTFGTGGSLSEGNLTNVTNNPIVVTYTFSVSTTATPSCPLVVGTQQTTVTVQPAPSFSISNVASSICSGSKTDLTLNTSVSGGQIRLKSVTYGAVTGSLTAGALYADGQTISETLVNTTNAPITVQYEFESFAGPCGPGTPSITTVTVNPNPSFSITNTTAAICSGSAPVLSVSSPTSGAVITLQSVNYGALSNGVYSGGGTFGTGGSLSEGNLTNVTNNPIVVTYTFSVSTTATPSCPLVVSTQQTTVTVQPAPSFSISNVASSICSGSKTDLTLNTSVSGGQIRLKSVTYGAVTGSLTAGALYADGQTISETLVNTTNAPITVQYEFESFAGPCGPGTPSITTVTVNPNPSFSITNTTAAICSGSAPVLSVSSPTSGAVITLQSVNYGALSNGVYSGGGTFGTGGSLSEGNLTNVTNNPIVVTYTFSVSTTATPSCPLVVSTQQTTVTVQPAPSFSISNVASSICSGSKTDLTLNTPVSGGQIRLKSVTYGAVTGSLTAGALYADGQTISETLVNTTNAPITVQYEFESFAGTCGPGTPSITTVTVNPNPSFSITNTTAAICSGSAPVLSVSSPTSGAVITLQSVNYGALSNGAYSGGGTFGTGGSLSEGNLTNVTNNPIVVTYTFSVSTTASPSCPLVVSTQQTTVTVDPIPTVVFFGLPSDGPPPQIAENSPAFKVSGTQKGGLFTISPGIGLGNTVLNPTDEAIFDPDAATIYDGHPSTINTITYTYTNENGCTNSSSQSIIVNAITSVDFAIQGATLDGSNNYELCAELGQVKLLGFPDPSTGLSGSFESLTPGLTITSSGSNYFIETNGLVSGTYDIKYTYTNVVNATSFRIRTVKIYASPVAELTSSNSCIISDVVFTDTSTINPTPFTTSIGSWQWNFGDNDFSTIQNPSKRYATSNTYYVTLKVTTLQGCSNTSAATAHPVRVGDVPIVNYDWSAICTNDNTNFYDRTTKVQGAIPSGISTITSYTWNFGDGDILTAGIGAIPSGTHNGKTFGTYKDPKHNYSVNGTYTATLIVDTNDGCSSTKSQNIFILPAGSTVTPQTGTPYLADFEGNDAGWVPEAVSPSDTSWIWGSPTGDAINTAAGGLKAWWTGKNANTYYPLEHSVINGPCFDLTQLDRPMVAMDYWSDLEKDVDGAVLQYSVDGGLSWRIVGPAEGQSNRDEGINWFNSAAIISNPGGQAIGPYGWTNKIGKWTNGRFNLDMIPTADRDQVRLRIAFSSNDGNPTTNNVFYDGFAFDNFFVGNKTKNVLVEHFTDGNSKASVDGDEYLDNLYQKQFTLHGSSDFNDIRYHISSGSVPDPLNQDNQADPGARATYMGVSQPPTTLMDGILNSRFTGKYTDLDDKGVELDRRALEDPLFDLALDTVATGVNNTIKVNLTITSRKIYSEPLIAQVVLMENSIGAFHNVLRKSLFGSDGQVIANAFVAGQSKVETNLETDINVPIVNSNQLSLIGYVQNKNTREIYQSIKIAAPRKKGRIIVGLEDEVIPTTLNGITIFPNPADGVFNFGIPDPNSITGYSWKISDQRGVIVRSGDFRNSFDGRKQVDISGLPNAVYFVIITGPGHSVVYRKLVILNKG